MPRRIQKRYWNKMIKSFCYAKLLRLILCCTFSDIVISGTRNMKLNFYLVQNIGFEIIKASTNFIFLQWYYYKYCYTAGFQRIYFLLFHKSVLQQHRHAFWNLIIRYIGFWFVLLEAKQFLGIILYFSILFCVTLYFLWS